MKKLLLILILFCLSIFSFSQEPKTTFCVSHGKPCPVWLHKLIGQYPPVKDTREYPERGEGFISFGHVSNSRTLKSKIFWISNGALISSMVLACRSKTSGENFDSEAGAVAGVIGMNYISYRFLSPVGVVGTDAYGTYHYLHALLK